MSHAGGFFAFPYFDGRLTRIMGVNTEASRVSAFFRSPEWGLLVSILLVLGLIYYLDPTRSFFSWNSREALTHQIGLYGVLAVGAAVVIISGGSTCPSARWWRSLRSSWPS